MTLHYRALPDFSGANFDPTPDTTDLSSWTQPLGTPIYGAGGTLAALRVPPVFPAMGSRYARVGKRLLDLVVGSIALFLAAPVLVALVVALWIESGNPFYTQLRLGMNGRHFRMFKLRTMVKNAETLLAECLERDPALRAEWDLTQKLKRDPRITPIGRLLRKTSLDELPQILNVLKGDMSLVGPRPMLPEQMPLYRTPQAYLGVRPGITGLWQVTARNEESFDLRAALDMRYAQRLGLGTDLRIMLSTFGAVFNATGY